MPINTPEVYIEEHNLTIGSPETGSLDSWPVHWSAIWVGALTAITAALLFGLVGMAVGAHEAGKKMVRPSDLSFGGLVFSVTGPFLSFVIGGWIAARIAGMRRAEAASLQGGIVWRALAAGTSPQPHCRTLVARHRGLGMRPELRAEAGGYVSVVPG